MADDKADEADEADDEAENEVPDGSSGAGSSGAGSSGGRSRSARIAEALADLAEQARREVAEREAQEAKRQARSAAKGGGPVDGRVPAGQEIMLAEQALSQARATAAARWQAWQDSGRGQRPPEVEAHWRVVKGLKRLARARQIVATRAARPPRRLPRPPVRNITDPQSRPQPIAGGGWLQGYNAQAVTDANGVIWAVEVSNSPSDQPTFLPMVAEAAATAERVGAGPIGLVLADAGYLSVGNLTAPGPDRLIAVGNRRKLETAARTPPDEPGGSDDGGGGGRGGSRWKKAVQAMRDRLAAPEGITAYRQRGRIAETPFGHGKHNLGFRRFTGIGLERARTEWRFHAAVHNLSKIITSGRLAAPSTG